MGEDRTSGHSRPDIADVSSESGWVTTDVAARTVRVSPRTIRRYINQGRLEAKPHGEGVRREWLISVDSLHALRSLRTEEAATAQPDREVPVVDSIADVLREMSARLERRAEEAAELRVRLELTERAQSTLDDERRQALEDLAEERRRREEAEQEREDLRRRLEAATTPEPPGAPESAADEQQGRGAAAAGAPQEATERPFTEEEPEHRERSWWRRFFGFE